MQMKSRKWHAILTCTIVALAVGGSIAGSEIGNGDSPTEPEANSPAEEPVDVAVEFYALDYSVSLDEARRRLDRISGIQEALKSIRNVETARLAGWGIDHRGSFGGWVLLVGDAPPSAAAAAVADAHDDVEIRTGARHSYAELLAAQKALSADLFASRNPTGSSGGLGNTGGDAQATAVVPGDIDYEEQAASGVPGDLEGPDVGGGAVGVETDLASVVTFLETDMAGNAVRVGIDPALAPDTGPLGTVSELDFDQSATIVAELLDDHIGVAFTIADGRNIAPAASFQGGQKISVCTSGFTAREFHSITGYSYGYYDYGIITAGHCGHHGPTQNETFSMNGYMLPIVNGWASATADAQFHLIPTLTTESHQVLDDYICRDPDIYPNHSCDVTGIKPRLDMKREDMTGDYVCHTGRKSGTSCGEIIAIDHRPSYANDDPHPACSDNTGARVDCEGVFVRAHGPYLKGCEGDSGGPFFRGGTAYGIQMAGNDAKDCVSGGKWVIFSAIDEVESFLGVEVLTEPYTLSWQ